MLEDNVSFQEIWTYYDIAVVQNWIINAPQYYAWPHLKTLVSAEVMACSISNATDTRYKKQNKKTMLRRRRNIVEALLDESSYSPQYYGDKWANLSPRSRGSVIY